MKNEKESFNNKSWSSIYNEHKPYIEKIVFFKMNVSAEERKDITSEIMIRIYQQRALYKSEYSFKSWITTLAINFCYGYYNKSQRRVPVINEDISEIRVIKRREIENPETLFIQKDQIERFITLISNFREVEFNVLFLRYLEGYKYEDIASKLDISLSLVKNIIRNRRHELENIAKCTLFN